MKRTTLMLAALALVAAPGLTKADTINFGTYPSGTPITSLDGITFSLVGGPDSSGPPLVGYDSAVPTGLTNSTNPDYPTANILNFAFSTPVSGVSFTLNNYGDNGTTFYAAYSGATLVATANVSADQGFGLITVPGSGITDIQFNNGDDSSTSWYFAVPTISFTASSVPEPGSFILLGLGLAGVVGYHRARRRQA
jgi:hypothetical protein